jgi:hypothetical protein
MMDYSEKKDAQMVQDLKRGISIYNRKNQDNIIID